MKGCGCIDAMSTLLPRCCCFCQANSGGFGGGSFANAGASAGGFGGSSFAQVQTGVTFTRLSVLFVSLDIIMCAEAGIIVTESRELETC